MSMRWGSFAGVAALWSCAAVLAWIRGGSSAWLLVYSIGALLLYAIGVSVLSLQNLRAERTLSLSNALAGGDVQVTFVSMGPHIEFVRQGKLRILGAATPERAPYVPDAPTFAEQGFPGFETSTWFSLFAPRGTPTDIVEQLNGYVRALGRDPDARKRLEANFIDPADMTASEFGDLVKADAVKWERIVRDAGVKID